MRAFRLAYDGRPFHGFQRQPDVPTVEGALFDALAALGVAEDAPSGYAAAGRTDAGVSAVAQTVAFDCPDWCSPGALNAELPDTVRAWAAVDVPGGFHATHDAAEREYVYHLYAPGADLDVARVALAELRGTNDFHNLTPADGDTVRTLEGRVERDGPYLVFTFRAGGFVHELVRRLVALVHAVAAGDATVERVGRALDDEPLDGPEGIGPAPAYPLVLTDVVYPDVTFEADPDAAPAVRDAFERFRVEHATVARVLGEVEARIE